MMNQRCRSQIDGHGDEMSRATSIDFHPDDDFTRQEFKEESDINTLLARFQRTGVLPASNSSSPAFGVQDMDVNLQSAMQAVQRAREAYEALSPELRARHPTWRDLAAFIDAGGLDVPETPVSPPAPPSPAPPSPETGTT